MKGKLVMLKLYKNDWDACGTRYNILDRIKYDPFCFNVKAISPYIEQAPEMRQMLHVKRVAEDALRKCVTPEVFSQIKKAMKRLDTYEQSFYFASGMANAYRMYLNCPLKDPSQMEEEDLMGSRRLYEQPGYNACFDELRSMMRQCKYTGDVVDEDTVEEFNNVCFRIIIERNIYYFLYGMESGIRILKTYDRTFNEDAVYMHLLYDRLAFLEE